MKTQEIESQTTKDSVVEILKEMSAQGVLAQFIDPNEEATVVELQLLGETIQCELCSASPQSPKTRN